MRSVSKTHLHFGWWENLNLFTHTHTIKMLEMCEYTQERLLRAVKLSHEDKEQWNATLSASWLIFEPHMYNFPFHWQHISYLPNSQESMQRRQRSEYSICSGLLPRIIEVVSTLLWVLVSAAVHRTKRKRWKMWILTPWILCGFFPHAVVF